MLIIAGHLTVNNAERDEFVLDCRSAVEAARAAPGCLDFSITADTVDDARVCIYERWETEEQLLDFRGSGPSAGQQAAITDADVRQFPIVG